MHGLGRFPVTLYKEQWPKLLGLADEIRAFMKENDADHNGQPPVVAKVAAVRARLSVSARRVAYQDARGQERQASSLRGPRVTRTDGNLPLLKVKMGAGQGGRSGRWSRLREVAEAHGSILAQMGCAQVIRRFLAVLLLAAAPWAASAEAVEGPIPVEVTVRRDGDRWTAEFHFLEPARAWAFTHSAVAQGDQQPWRPPSWMVETPGVRLERRGSYDVLVAEEGGPVPERVRVAFTPYPGELSADYDPALVFSNGSVALYSEQFDAVPLASPEAAARLPVDLSTADLPFSRTRVTFRDAGEPVLSAGRRVDALTLDDDEGTYVLFGPADPIVTDDMTAILDPQLPQWIRDTLLSSVPEILARYGEALGPATGPKTTLMVSWSGPTAALTSMRGSVLPGLVAMSYEGPGVLEESPQGRAFGLWAIAHESAHFWLGNTVRCEYARDAWITEGGADLLAFQTVSAVDPTYDARAGLSESIRDCIRLSQGRGIAAAHERNEHGAYNACGAVFALVAEAASHRPFIHFVRDLIRANRDDGVVTRAEWLATLDRVSRDRSLSRDIGVLLDAGSDDPAAAIASLFTRVGLAFVRGEGGLPVLR